MIDMQGMKNEMKLVEWTRLIEQRVKSGKTIKAWCEAQGIRRRLYYYWQRRVREAAVKNVAIFYPGITNSPIIEEATSLPMVENATPEFARIEIKNTGSILAMSIRAGMAECEIYNGADIDIVERALLTLLKI